MGEDSEECDKNGCNNKSSGECNFCGRNFCKEHLKQKLTGSRSFISSITNPELKKVYGEESKSDDGHPCPNYTEKFLKEFREKEKEEHIDFTKLRQILDSVEATGEKCFVMDCSRPATATCRCGHDYCFRHIGVNLRATKSQDNGHPCSNELHRLYPKVYGKPR